MDTQDEDLKEAEVHAYAYVPEVHAYAYEDHQEAEVHYADRLCCFMLTYADVC